MKAIALLCTLFVVSLVEGRAVEPSATPARKFTPLQEACLTELKLEAKRDDIANLHNRAVCPEDNSNYNSFISCFWKKTNRQKQNGEINYDNLREYVRAGIIQGVGNDPAGITFANHNSEKIVQGCKDVSGETPEKTVVRVRNCIVTGLDNIGKN